MILRCRSFEAVYGLREMKARPKAELRLGARRATVPPKAEPAPQAKNAEGILVFFFFVVKH